MKNRYLDINFNFDPFGIKIVLQSWNVSYSDHKKQKVITTIFAKLLEIRKQIVENPENTTNPSNLNGLLTSSYDVQSCIVNYSSGM